jgi:hypothetical protein
VEGSCEDGNSVELVKLEIRTSGNIHYYDKFKSDENPALFQKLLGRK